MNAVRGQRRHPRLLTRDCAREPGKGAYELRRLIAGKEPNRRTTWPADTPVAPVRMYLEEEKKESEPENQLDAVR